MIYMVFGATGEYSDYEEWPVAAYRSLELAMEHVLRAQALAREAHALEYESFETYWSRMGKVIGHALDPEFRYSIGQSAGCVYLIHAAPEFEEVPEVMRK